LGLVAAGRDTFLKNIAIYERISGEIVTDGVTVVDTLHCLRDYATRINKMIQLMEDIFSNQCYTTRDRIENPLATGASPDPGKAEVPP
jgi:hypothetical protein